MKAKRVAAVAAAVGVGLADARRWFLCVVPPGATDGAWRRILTEDDL